MPNYTFGSFVLNASSNGLGYFLVSKDIDLPVIKPTTALIARRIGVKKTGESVDARTITLGIQVVGSSRTDLISRLDSLTQALSLRGQACCIHEDGRYFQNCDALSGPIKFSAGGGIVQALMVVVITAYDPYAYASMLSTYDTGTVALSLVNGNYTFPALLIPGGGTVASLPLIRLYNRTASGATQWTSLTISQTTDNQQLSATSVAAAPLPAVNGDYVDIQCDPSQVNGWTIQTNNSGKFTEPTGVFPVLEPGATAFTISVASSAAVSAEAVFSWTSRYAI